MRVLGPESEALVISLTRGEDTETADDLRDGAAEESPDPDPGCMK